jgi:ATP phosphoribosyltransferase regulatory subunit
MSSQDQWLLPEGIEEVLPPESRRLEYARRELLDLFARWGYELVFPPFIEYLESLLTGTGNDLDLQTFKLTDQLTGRMMGVRADITPQAARIDAHPLRREAAARLCYLGTVLHTRPDGFAGSRSPLQVGAELFGHAGVESDVEILSLLLESLSLLAIPEVHVDLGHVGIFRALAADAGLSRNRENDLFAALQRKAVPEIEAMLDDWQLDAARRRRLAALAELNGGEEVLEQARMLLAGASDTVMQALDNLCAITALLQQRVQDVVLHFDLAELRGYKYQTGMVFAVFIPGCGQEIARGGRYDAIGEVFGHARPATGFSTDLKTLVKLSQRNFGEQGDAILAPADNDPGLYVVIQQLRRDGERVVCALPGQITDPVEYGCMRILVNTGGTWTLKPV